MGYDYESLTDQTFQQLVQALLINDYPNLACFPVGMPDGGRDATSGDHHAREVVVFQVKFSRNPSTIKDPYDWMTKAIMGEVPKIDQLVKRGAREYVLVTNLIASSHLDVGLMDRMQRFLDEVVEVPARCMWRADLDRRLDGNYDIKLRYPNLLNGPDILRELWENAGARDARDRRNDTIKTYLRDQYVRDATVRFKQVELVTSSLLDLFIDVPITLITPFKTDDRQGQKQHVSKFTAATARVARAKEDDSATRDLGMFEDFLDEHYLDGYGYASHRPRIGAADLLTEPGFLTETHRIVIEGAPGQGKSTLAQYLAQIQRIRLLEEAEEFSKVPKNHAACPIYLPIKIELRDLARWLRGFNPWTREPEGKHDEATTLETALVAHIRRFSGGHNFGVSDLLQIVKTTPVVLILDALDEVADLGDRQEIVNEIEAFGDRLERDSVNLLIIVTSRPTALSNAPALTTLKFDYYTLSALTPTLAMSYSNKWSKVRQLRDSDAVELVNILRTKLQSPHMAELAKNTMQLTILLSLIVARGSSLPDKRTELYTAYLDHFLSRESEKSPDVRDHRDLLLAIHGYLGYHLHAQAEGTRATGRMRVDELRQLIAEYLERDGHDTTMVQKLFDAVGRVFVLVSRIEGTFEFEVQPLREYFAARHLYHTAPIRPAWQECKGTKPDRFDGIAPNPYWMNVTRFFAGFFSMGELLDLAQRVCDLIKNPKNLLATYPRSLAVALLQDWVFSQSPRATEQVVKAVFDEVGICWAVDTIYHNGYAPQDGGSVAQLSPRAGAEQVAEILWQHLVSHPITERTHYFCRLMRQLSSLTDLHRRWTEQSAANEGVTRSDWAIIGLRLGLIDRAPAEHLSRVLDLDKGDPYVNERVCAALHEDIGVDKLPEPQVRRFVAAALDLGPQRPFIIRANMDIITRFLLVTHPYMWMRQLAQSDGMLTIISEMPGATKNEHGDESSILAKISSITTTLAETLHGDINVSLTPWEQCVDLTENLFGHNWSSLHLSVAAAGIKSRSERAAGVRGLFEAEISLPRRIRFARRKAKSPEWWAGQAVDISSNFDAAVFLASCTVWAAGSTLMEILPIVDDVCSTLTDSDLLLLLRTVDEIMGLRGRGDPIGLSSSEGSLDTVRTGTVQLLMRRASAESRSAAILDRLLPQIDNPRVAFDCADFLVSSLLSGDIEPERVIKLFKISGRFEHSLTAPRVDGRRQLTPRERKRIPREEISAFCSKLPSALVAIAMTASDRQLPKSIPVLTISEREGWFDEF